MIILKIIAIILNTLDYILTIYALKRGAREANPIARFGLKRFPKITFIFKCILFNCLILRIEFYTIISFIIVIFGLVCLNNLIVVRQLKRKYG